MTTRLTPVKARQISETKAKEERDASKAVRRGKIEEARAKANEELAWSNQIQKLLRAAMTGSSEVSLHEKLTRPSELINGSFQLFACITEKEELADAQRLLNRSICERKTAASAIIDAAAAWLRALYEIEPELCAHKPEVKKELNRLIKEALSQSSPNEMISLSFILRMDSAELLSLVDLDRVSELSETDAFDQVLESYCAARGGIKEARDWLSEIQDPPLVSIDATRLEAFAPPFTVKWQPISVEEPWGERSLLSASGLGWISGKPGQLLIHELEERITRSASQQKNHVVLEISHRKLTGHYIVIQERHRMHFPPGEEILKMLACLDWIATVKGDSRSHFDLEISW